MRFRVKISKKNWMCYYNRITTCALRYMMYEEVSYKGRQLFELMCSAGCLRAILRKKSKLFETETETSGHDRFF
jgi:hypothetical protein